MPLRHPPSWWDWDLEITAHADQRMDQRGVTEVELRAMLTRAHSIRANVLEGRFIVVTTHGGRDWEVILEPDDDLECLAVVTMYAVERA